MFLPDGTTYQAQLKGCAFSSLPLRDTAHSSIGGLTIILLWGLFVSSSVPQSRVRENASPFQLCGHRYTSTCACVCLKSEADKWVISQLFSTFYAEAGTLEEPKVLTTVNHGVLT